MLCELPISKRCCFCLPLRYGLIFWGYLKLVFCGLATTLITLILGELIHGYHSEDEISYKIETFNVVLTFIAIFIVIADVILSIIFIVGCHKKNVKVLKTYYFYSIFLLALTSGILIYNILEVIYYTLFYYDNRWTMATYMYEFFNWMTFLGNLLLQAYIILLLRSEIIKLNNGCQFRFLNNVTEPQCTLDVEHAQVEKENKKNTNGVEEDNKKNTNGVDNDDEIRVHL